MQSSFSFPPPRNGSNRPQPQRANSHKSSPYQRPGSLSSSTTSTSNGASSSDKWQHDLFGSSSDLYKPSINVSHLSKIIPGAQPVSASLRPFGDATPAPQRLIHTSSDPLIPTTSSHSARSVPPAAATPAPQDLMTRLGIKGSSNQQAQLEQERQEKERQRLLRAEKVRIERERREQLRLRKELEKDREEKLKIAEFEETGFVVQVEGLVYGTSAEDVQTAFGSYGEIKHCFIVNEKAAKEGDQLIARITFSRHEDAKTACHKLDGAIADGRPLKVQNVPRSPFPPSLPPLPAILAANSAPPSPAATSPLPVGPRGSNAGRGRGRARMGPSIVATPPAPAPIPSKMYADTIEDVYETPALVASTSAPTTPMASESMDVDMVDSPVVVPAGPRRGGGAAFSGRGGASRGRAIGLAGRVIQPQQPLPAAPVSLLDRVNGGGNKTPTGTKSLAERLGQTGSTTTVPNVASGQWKGGKGNGKPNGATNAGGVGSLLSRLH
ncbi:hypothetical protein JCM3765_007702 [Sporobolomyces pararoseus]